MDRDSSETSPLLSPSAAPVHSETQSSQFTPKKPSRARIIILLLLYLVFLDLGYELIVPAQTRVFEQVYCRLYYEEHDPSLIGSDGKDGVDEKWCKVDVVQGEVAMLKAWQIALDSVGSEFPLLSHLFTLFPPEPDRLVSVLVFSVPWAYAADSYGRKPVILLLTLALFVK